MEKYLKYIFLLPMAFFTSFFTVYTMEMERPLIIGKVYISEEDDKLASQDYSTYLNNIGLSCDPGTPLAPVFVDVIIGYRSQNHEIIHTWTQYIPWTIKYFENNDEAIEAKTFPKYIPWTYLNDKKFGDILEIATIYGYPVQLTYSVQ